MQHVSASSPVLQEIVKRLVDRKVNSVQVTDAPRSVALAKCDDLADQLEQALAQAPKPSAERGAAPGAAAQQAALGSDGGLIARGTDLVAALRSGNYEAIKTALVAFVRLL